MPERARAVCAMVDHLEGGVSFNAVDDVARLGPADDKRDIPMDEYYDRFDGAFVAAMDRVNWNRVLLEAQARHMTMKKKDPEHKTAFDEYGDDICPECLGEAILGSGYQNWDDEPIASRTRLQQDRL